MRAINHVRRLGGGQSEPHLFTCDDADVWVLKLPGNPQSVQLGQDFLGLLLARQCGIAVPDPAVVEVSGEVLVTMDDKPAWAVGGIALGTRYIANTTGFSPNSATLNACRDQVAQLLVFDCWVETLDRRRPDGAWNLLVRTDTAAPALLAVDFGFALNATATLGSAALIPESYPLEFLRTALDDDIGRAVTNLRTVTTRDLGEVVSSVPSAWMDADVKQRTLDFLEARHRRIMSGELVDAIRSRRS